MSSATKNFIDLCIDGEVDLDEIDDFIDLWNESDLDIPLYTFLGMTKLEYNEFVKDASTLPHIIMSKKYGIKLEDALQFQNGIALAARAKTTEEANKIDEWIKSKIKK